jgi:hypothetical protein
MKFAIKCLCFSHLFIMKGNVLKGVYTNNIFGDIKILRITKQMTNRANPVTKNLKDYFRIVLFIPF